MEGTHWEKFGVLLIVLGLVIGAIGGAGSFLVSPWAIWIFYLGFLVAIVGFAIAVFTKVGTKEKK